MVPTYLEKFQILKESDERTERVLPFLVCSADWDILYAGEIWEECVTWRAENPQMKVLLQHKLTKKEMLLFDIAKYGYNGMFCEVYQTSEQLE
ncbi:hypothetical protein [Listeria costaricensis]|uniref:hypothetical protein n=1 Tax=Listeria costaricensis TaxID=2026604 RepID=UPI000C0729CE|nr:hypothetical protein [Listeria costaricensis]